MATVGGWRSSVAGLAVVLVASACTGDGNGQASTATPSSIETTTSLPYLDDGVYRIVVFAPQEGAGAILGRGIRRGVELAVDEIRAAGGVGGEMVDWVDVAEPSDPGAAIEAARDAIAGGNVDAVIGPASSAQADSVVGELQRTSLVCTPTATSYTLTDMPDGRSIRTILSDQLEAVALARTMTSTGRRSAVVVAPDDDYGSTYAAALGAALPPDVEQLGTVYYDLAAEDYTALARQALDAGAETMAVIGGGDKGALAMTALLEAREDLAPAERPQLLVSSGLRSILTDAGFAPELDRGPESLRGVSPHATGSPEFEQRLATRYPDEANPYAANAYDCAVLLALAVEAAGTSDPDQAKKQLPSVAKEGAPCRSFGECVELLRQGQNIDFDGASGPLDLNADGDVTSAFYDAFTIGPDGRELPPAALMVRAG